MSLLTFDRECHEKTAVYQQSAAERTARRSGFKHFYDKCDFNYIHDIYDHDYGYGKVVSN